MNIRTPVLTSMLDATRSAGGAVALLSRLNTGDPNLRHYSPAVSNTDGISPQFYRKLKVFPAAWVAGSASDPALLRYIAAKDKRQHVQLALGWNPSLPADVVTYLQANGPEVLRRDELFHSLHNPLDVLLTKAPHHLSRREKDRILKETTDEQLQQWWDTHLEALTTSRLPLEHLGAPQLREVLRVLPLIECPNRRLNTILSACVLDQAIDWSTTTWEALLDYVPTDEEYIAGIGNTMSPNGFAIRKPPVEWVRFVLQRTSNTKLRKFATTQASAEAVFDPGVREGATAYELARMASAGAPYLYSESAVRLASKKMQEVEDVEAAAGMAADLDQGLPDEVKEPVYRLALRVDHENPALVGVNPRMYRQIIEHSIKKVSEGKHAFPDEVRSVLLSSPSGRCGEYLQDSSLFDDYPDHPFLRSLLPIVPGDVSLYSHFGPAAMVAKELDRRIPDATASTWSMFLDMSEGWEGSITELLDTLEATL